MSKKLVIIGGVIFGVLFLAVFFAFTFMGNDYSVPQLPVYYSSHDVKHFTLKDQRGRVITEDSVKNKVFVVNFFFTSCHDVCISMNRNVKKIYNALHQYPDFMILSHTVNPSIDSVPVLAKYARQWHANPDQWLFLTGSETELYHLARQVYMLGQGVRSNGTQDSDSSDFVHTQLIALIGRQGRIRGIFNSLKYSDIKRCIRDAKYLLAKHVRD